MKIMEKIKSLLLDSLVVQKDFIYGLDLYNFLIMIWEQMIRPIIKYK